MNVPFAACETEGTNKRRGKKILSIFRARASFMNTEYHRANVIQSNAVHKETF